MNVESMKTDDSPAQTASVGDRVMMTYMKLPMPNIDGAAPGGPDNNDSDDARFLDGLFDRLSGSSDNGSDKDAAEKGSGSSSPQTSRNLVVNPGPGPESGHGRSITATSHSAGSVAGHGQNLPDSLLPASLMSSLGGQLPSSNQSQTSSDVSYFTSTSVPQTQAPQAPQHFMYQQQTENSTGFVAVNMNANVNVNVNQHQHQPNVNVGAATAAAAAAAPIAAGPIPTPVTSATPMDPWIQKINPPTATVGQVQVQVQSQKSAGTTSSSVTSCSTTSSSVVRLPPDRQGMHAHAHIPQLPLPNPKQFQAPIFADVTTSTSTATTSRMPKPTPAHVPALSNRGRKRRNSSSIKKQISSISEDEEDMEKRRRERNMREQERSQRISSQIAELKGLLASSNVSFKPDKYSTLVSVYEYIQTLQQRSALLDAEQRKIVETITKSNDLVAKSELGHRAVPNSNNGSPRSSSTGDNFYHDPSGRAVIMGPGDGTGEKEEDELLAHVRGVDYKNIFARIRIGLAVTSIDGRLLACNDEFVGTCQISRETLVSSGMRSPQEGNKVEMANAGKHPLSLFNLMGREDMQNVFEAMSTMLRGVQVQQQQSERQKSGNSGNNHNEISSSTPNVNGAFVQKYSSSLKSDHWQCIISKCHNTSAKMQLNISLVRQSEGVPRFFNCALTTVND